MEALKTVRFFASKSALCFVVLKGGGCITWQQQIMESIAKTRQLVLSLPGVPLGMESPRPTNSQRSRKETPRHISNVRSCYNMLTQNSRNAPGDFEGPRPGVKRFSLLNF